MDQYWDDPLPQHPGIAWAVMGREQTEPLLTESGRALFEFAPIRVSGSLL
jgi:hypothetical protein